VTKANVIVRDGEIVFDYVGKAGKRQQQAVQDELSGAVVRALKRRRSGGEKLLAYRIGREWHEVRSEQINDYLKSQIGDAFSAKDFRTWNATVLAAVSLAADGRDAATRTARKRAMDGAVRGVSEVLGNTPAVARRSYIDPRVFDRYLSGWTIGGEIDRIGRLRGPDDRRRARLEAAVIDLLHDDRGSPAVVHDVSTPCA
jgi:DNA topoisomerase IB